MIGKSLRRHGLSAAGAQVLGIVEGAGGPISPTVIADRLIVTTATVTSLLDTLERRGLVQRRPDPVDRRKVLVALTDEAYELVDRFLPEIVALQTAIMTGIPEVERQRLRRTLARVRTNIASLDADAVVAAAGPRRRPSRRPG